MNPQVLPLKVLVSRDVVRNKMDYSTFLNGTLKEELDRLDCLAGNFRIEASKLVIEGSKFLYEYRGKIVPSDDVQKLKTELKLPETETVTLINFIDGMAKFRIEEKVKGGRRTWTYCDVNGKRLDLMSNVDYWEETSMKLVHRSDFIEDGWVVNVTKASAMLKGKMTLWLDIYDAFTIDKEGNLHRKFVWRAPHRDITVTRILRSIRIIEGQKSEPRK